jgi:undecaprenyl diphosphate synthase
MHVALILDGNGRWAQARALPRLAGHRAGVEAVRRAVEAAAVKEQVSLLTLYAFSSDNWKRPATEVKGLMRLLGAYLSREGPELRRQGVRASFIGRRDRLPQSLQAAMESVEKDTLFGKRLHLRIAVDYSARESIRQGQVGPDVDLLIRTGGEKRLSDFLLWESAYAELVFLAKCWPDFSPEDLDAALADYAQRERRFGALPAA